MSNAHEFIEKFTDIHPLPHIVTTISRLIADNSSTMKDFEDVIKMDPVLVTRTPPGGPGEILKIGGVHNMVIGEICKEV